MLETEETSQNIVLLSKQDGPSDVDWLDAEIFVDYTTLKDIFDAAGIPVEIRVDWENERIYIDTLKVSRGRLAWDEFDISSTWRICVRSPEHGCSLDNFCDVALDTDGVKGTVSVG